MYEYHKDKKRYVALTHRVTDQYVIPFIESVKALQAPLHVLEIGSGEGGVIQAFVEKGHHGLGIELSPSRVALAKEFHDDWIRKGKLDFWSKNIYDIRPDQDFEELFDVIVMKDVIEHIPDQEKFIPWLKQFLKPGGVIFFGFPPWQMPFGGHQQMLENKWLSKMPYIHLLPWTLYRKVLSWGGEREVKIIGQQEIWDTGISIERFKRIVAGNGMTILAEKYWLINPVYESKFNLKPRVQLPLITRMPWVRNFLTTAVYFLVGVNDR